MGCVCAGWRGAERSVANGWGSPVWESESRLDLFIPHQLCPALPRVRGLGVTDTGPLLSQLIYYMVQGLVTYLFNAEAQPRPR